MKLSPSMKPCDTCGGRDTIVDPLSGQGEPYTCPDCGGSGRATDTLGGRASEHTPYPWTYRDGRIFTDDIPGYGSALVAEVRGWGRLTGAVGLSDDDVIAEQDRVGHVLASAPDLLAALESAVEQYGKPGGPWSVPDDPGGWLALARAALKKARGET